LQLSCFDSLLNWVWMEHCIRSFCSSTHLFNPCLPLVGTSVLDYFADAKNLFPLHKGLHCSGLDMCLCCKYCLNLMFWLACRSTCSVMSPSLDNLFESVMCFVNISNFHINTSLIGFTSAMCMKWWEGKERCRLLKMLWGNRRYAKIKTWGNVISPFILFDDFLKLLPLFSFSSLRHLHSFTEITW